MDQIWELREREEPRTPPRFPASAAILGSAVVVGRGWYRFGDGYQESICIKFELSVRDVQERGVKWVVRFLSSEERSAR